MLDKIEEQRLTICFGIVATVFAVIAFVPDGYWSFLKGIFAISGFCAFLYILLTATKLKHKDPKAFGFMEVPDVMRKVLYDISIDVYGSNLMLVLAFSSGYLLQTDKSKSTADVGWQFFLIGIATSIVFLLFFSVIEWRKNKKRSK